MSHRDELLAVTEDLEVVAFRIAELGYFNKFRALRDIIHDLRTEASDEDKQENQP